MAEYAGEYSDVDALLECGICLEQFTDPRTLPCLHTYCLKCMESHANSSAVRGRFNCPACRKVCMIPGGGIKEFPKNFFVNTMLSSKTSYAAKKTKPRRNKKLSKGRKIVRSDETKCANFEDGEVHDYPVEYCEKCEEFLCSECASGHRRYKATRHHSIITVEEQQSPDVSDDSDNDNTKALSKPRCRTHGQELMLYCLQCSVVICPGCFNDHHIGHRCGEIEAVAADFRRKLGFIDTDVVDCGTQYGALVQEVQEKRKVYISESTKVRKALEASLEKIFKLLQDKNAELTREIDQNATEAFTKLHSTEEAMKKGKAVSEGVHEKIAQLISANTGEVAFVEKAAELLDEINQISRPQPRLLKQSFQINYNYVDVSTLQKLIGSINIKRTIGEAAAAAESSNAGMMDTIPTNLRLLDTINVSACIMGMALLKDKVYMIQQGIRGVAIYDTHRRTLTTMPIAGLKDPRTLTITKDGSGIMITEGQLRQDYMVTSSLLFVLNNRGEFGEQILTNLSGIVTGVSPSNDVPSGLLITSVNPKQIVRYQVTLQPPKMTYRGSTCLAEESFSTDICAVENGLNLAILDAQMRKVTWVDLNGRPLFYYQMTAVPKSPQYPMSNMVQYSNDHLLIVDSVRCEVIALNADGHGVSTVLTRNDGIVNAHNIHWDSSRGELYVAEMDVQFRPPYSRGSQTPLINVYSLPPTRGQTAKPTSKHMVPPGISEDVTIKMCLPHLVDKS